MIVDAAAEFPPFSILSHYWKLGADLTLFSGGKGLRGPQSSGLILGRKDLVEACAMNSSPNHGVGRPMKVGKEEIVGLLTAVELWSEPDFERKMFDRWRLLSDAMIETLSQVPGVRAWKGGSPPASTGLAVHPDGLPSTKDATRAATAFRRLRKPPIRSSEFMRRRGGPAANLRRNGGRVSVTTPCRYWGASAWTR